MDIILSNMAAINLLDTFAIVPKSQLKGGENNMKIWDFLKGKKTYLVALLAIAYGYYYKDPNAILIGLSAAGIRNGISTEITKMLTK